MATSILITGASGYIGGTILNDLLKSQRSRNCSLKISALARKASHISKLKELGVEPIAFDDFDDTTLLQNVAMNFDVIIHAGAGWHVPSSVALISGQGKRRERTGKEMYYFQISGTSNMSDRPHSKQYLSHTDQVFTDTSSIYYYEKYRESMEPYHQRTADIAVVETGIQTGVKTCVVMAPTIFGIGTGPFNTYSIQIPSLLGAAMKVGYVGVLGDGSTKWNHIHIEDLSELSLTLLEHTLAGPNMPHGVEGIYFAESGEHTHREMSELLAQAMYQAGITKSKETRQISLQEAAKQWAMGHEGRAELAFGSNARTKAELARKLGWQPKREQTWKRTFSEELVAMQKNPPSAREMPKVFQSKH